MLSKPSWNPFVVGKRDKGQGSSPKAEITCVRSYAVHTAEADGAGVLAHANLVPTTISSARYSSAGPPPPLPLKAPSPPARPRRPPSPLPEHQVSSQNGRRRSDSAHSNGVGIYGSMRYPQLDLDGGVQRSKVAVSFKLRFRRHSQKPESSSSTAPIQGMGSLVNVHTPIEKAEICEPKAVPLYRPGGSGGWIDVESIPNNKRVKVFLGPYDKPTINKEMLAKIKAARKEEQRAEELERAAWTQAGESQHSRQKVRVMLGI
ncbi:hypothetical protein JCM3765_004957 [Sporobolomyces pararoseus]